MLPLTMEMLQEIILGMRIRLVHLKIIVYNDKDIDRKHDTIGCGEKNRVQRVREGITDSSRKGRRLDKNTIIFH
jgi:hypothetical protein